MAIEESLNLDISPALASIRGELKREIESIPSTLRDAFSDALTGMASDVGAFAVLARDEIDRVLGAPIEAAVEVDTAGVDDAAAAIDDLSGTAIDVPVEADLAGLDVAEGAIDDLSGKPIEVPVEVEVAEIQAAAGELDALAESAVGAADAVGSIGEAASGAGGGGGFAGASAGAAGLRGSIEGLTGAQLAGVGAGAGLLATVGAFAREATTAESQTRSFEVRVGDLADTLNRVDVAGLNTSLSDLALTLGADDDQLRLTLARLVQLSDGSSRSREEVGQLGQEFVALAAYLSAVNPSLGLVDDVLASLPQALARGGRALAPFGLSISTLEIQTRAFSETGKTAAEDLTLFEKSAAALGIAMERLGPQIATGIADASENAEVRLRALKQSVLETIESVGQPLIGPVVAALESVTPALTETAGAIAEIGGAALTVAVPALGALGAVAKTAASAVSAIPTPVLAAGSAMVIGAKAAEGLGDIISGLVGKFGDLGKGAKALDVGKSLTDTIRAGAAASTALTAVREAATLATAKAAVADIAAAAAQTALNAANASGIGIEAAQVAAIEANTTARAANAAAATAQAAATQAAAATAAASLGPVLLVGAAIGAGVAALAISARQTADYAKIADDLRATLTAEAAAFTDVERAALAAGDAVESVGVKDQLSEAFGDDRLAQLQKAGITLDSVNVKINALATRSDVDLGRLRRAWVDLGREVPKNADQYALAVDRLRGQGRTQDEAEKLVQTLQQTGPELDILRGKFLDQAEARRQLIDDSVGFVEGLQSENEATRTQAAETLKLSGAYATLSPELQTVVDGILQLSNAEEASVAIAEANAAAIQSEADAANNAATGFTNALSALSALIGVTFDATSQDLDFTIGLDKMKQKQDELIKSKGATAAAFVLETAAGRENIASLVDQVKAQADLVAKNIDAGESIEKATGRYQKQVDALGAVAKEAGLTTIQYQNLLREFGLTPEQITTSIELLGIPEAKAEADEFKTYLEKLDPRVRAKLTLDDVEFYEALQRVKDKLAEVPGDSGFAAEFAASQIPGQAYGGIVYNPKTAATGGVNAGIYSASSGVMFNEPDAQGEAYVPFAMDRRERATLVLGETADRFGYALVPRSREQLSIPSTAAISGGVGGGGTAVLERIASLLDGLPDRMPAGVTANVELTTQETDVLAKLGARLRGH